MQNWGSEKTKQSAVTGVVELANGAPRLLGASRWLNAPHNGVLVSPLPNRYKTNVDGAVFKD